VSSLDFRSRYCGYDDNRVRTLFRLAHERQPCIVFIDDIDALLARRSDAESESSRRVKTQFLVQMQGMISLYHHD
jgi:vacuolar protein-sorting-associated protein 4